MKPFSLVSVSFRRASLLLALPASVVLAEEPANAAAKAGNKAADQTASKIEDYRTDHTELSKAEVKAALAQIDAELNHLDKLADAAPTPEQKADAQTRYAALKERRNELKKEFNRARYEEFKSDLQAELDRVSAWARETFQTKPAATSAASATSATADAASEKIASYRHDSSDINKAEVHASLARLDADIDVLAAKIDALADPTHKAELQQRLAAIKDRRSELNSQFRKARYEALVADVKAEWNKLTN
jgi:hypothetical protein